jgi:hypothetical protein
MIGECSISERERKKATEIANKNTVSYLDLQTISSYFRDDISEIKLNSSGIDLFFYLESKARRASLLRAVLDRDSKLHELAEQNDRIRNMIITDPATESNVKNTESYLILKLDEQNRQLMLQEKKIADLVQYVTSVERCHSSGLQYCHDNGICIPHDEACGDFSDSDFSESSSGSVSDSKPYGSYKEGEPIEYTKIGVTEMTEVGRLMKRFKDDRHFKAFKHGPNKPSINSLLDDSIYTNNEYV